MSNMTLEEQLHNKILEKYRSVRAFTMEIGVPYDSVKSILKRPNGIKNASVSLVLKIFDALDLDIYSIATGTLAFKGSPMLQDIADFLLSDAEANEENGERNSFSLRLKELREAAGYTQQSFADAFGVAQSTVGNWEAGRRELKRGTLMKLAAFFDVSLDCLVGSLGKDTALDRRRIKEARQRAGLLQKDMAEQLGIASNTFHGYESGKHTPTPQMLRRIADICGVTVDYLLGGSEEEPSTERSNDVLAIAVETWGKDAQIDIAVEELSELIKALLKERRAVKTGCDAHIEAARKNVAEEMADVYIMLSQLGLIFHNRGEVQKQIDYKANRLFDRICEENEKV